MKIVIPVAGEGRRFREAGFAEPKMLIDTGGRPMLHWALDSLHPLVSSYPILFVCLADHLRHYPLEEAIYGYCPHAAVAALDEPTQGQAATVLAAASWLDDDEPLLIYNCDTYTKIETGLFETAGGFDGILPVFASRDPGFSYVAADSRGVALRVAEKEVISSFATTGMYHFTRAGLFLKAARAAMRETRTVNGEYFVAPLYNDLIRQGCRFEIRPAESCHPIGTPEQRQTFLRRIGQSGISRGDEESCGTYSLD